MKRKITINKDKSNHRTPPPPIRGKKKSTPPIPKEKSVDPKVDKQPIIPPKKESKKIQIKKIQIKRKESVTPPPSPPVTPTYQPPIVPPTDSTSDATPPAFDINDYKEKKKPWLLIIGAIVLILGIGGYFLKPILWNEPTKEIPKKTPQKKAELPTTVPTTTQPYEGFLLDDYHITQSAIGIENHLAELLEKHHLTDVQIEPIVASASNIAALSPLHHGRPYMLLADKNTADSLLYLIYEPNDYQYIVINIIEGNAQLVERKIKTELRTVAGMIKGEETLWDAVLRNQFRSELIEKMEEALKWRVDFYHVQPGDKFKIVYDEKMEGSKSVGVGQVYAVYFNTNGKEHYAYNYEYQQVQSFYNEAARPMKSTFLMSPVKYARISSNYNLQRKHPVTGEVKGHFGTDYAAPEGSPILAVADGVVTIATHKKNNGNYVKIKHDDTYTTQYLHMQKFEPGIQQGVSVKQGQIIGYVGQTGLATGPHVCFRFWKNDQQVNHLEEDLPLPNPLVATEITTFEVFRDSFNVVLNQLNYFN